MQQASRTGPRARAALLLALLLAAVSELHAQQPQPLTILDTSPPRGVAQFSYEFRLKADGGTPALHWKLAGGELPPGLELDEQGARLRGTPASVGEFRFTLSVTDSATPPKSEAHSFVLRVVAPLEAAWLKTPALDGDRILGSVRIANNAPEEVDLTLIVVAVNEVGKAFALGYQHLPMAGRSTLRNVPFGAQINLPRGRYVVHVDAVAELPARNAIFRARLERGTLQVP